MSPRGDEEVATLVRQAAESRGSLRIAGRGTWLGAGGPVHADETLSLAGDAGVVAYVPGDMTITVRAGTTLAEIDEVLAVNDQWLGLDPHDGTIGAIVATCSFGPSAASYGTPRDAVLGMTVVLGTGEIVSPGGRVVKNVAGFDLTRVMIGAWGWLGVITQVSLRVRPRNPTMGADDHMRRPRPVTHGFREPVLVHPRIELELKRRFDPHAILNPGIMSELLS